MKVVSRSNTMHLTTKVISRSYTLHPTTSVSLLYTLCWYRICYNKTKAEIPKYHLTYKHTHTHLTKTTKAHISQSNVWPASSSCLKKVRYKKNSKWFPFSDNLIPNKDLRMVNTADFTNMWSKEAASCFSITTGSKNQKKKQTKKREKKADVSATGSQSSIPAIPCFCFVLLCMLHKHNVQKIGYLRKQTDDQPLQGLMVHWPN